MSKITSLKRLALVSAMSVMLLPAGSAGAFEVSYDGGDTDFILNGAMDNKKAGQLVTLKVSDKDDNIIHTRQTYTKADGTYEFVFSFDYNGSAKVVVSESGELYDMPIYKSSSGEVDGAIGRLAGDEDIAAVIKEESQILQVDPDEYDVLSQSGLMNRFLDAQEITSIPEFRDAYLLAKFLVTAQDSENSDKLVEMEDKYSVIRAASASSLWSEYYSCRTSVREDVTDKIAGKTFEDMKSYAKARDEAFVIYMINSEENHSAKFKLIEDYNDVIGLDIGKYESLKSQFGDFTDELFGGAGFDDIADLKTRAEAAYDSVTSDDGGSSSGSFGGGKTSSVSVGGKYNEPDKVEPLTQFSDLDGYDWARSSIIVLASKGVINGKTESEFAPGDIVTRAEFVKMLSAAFALSGAADVRFDDVPEGHWAYSYIGGAVSKGIVKGITDKVFGTNDSITRQDMAVLCSRIMDMYELEASDEAVVFKDADTISPYAIESVNKLAKAKIINGVGDGSFAPMNFATRAEAAVIIHRLQEYVGRR